MIDQYVDEISRRLVMTARRRARIVEDIRDHLEDAVEQLVSQGIDVQNAEERAIGAFGSASSLASVFNEQFAVGLLRRAPLTMAASGLVLVAGFLLAALSRSSRAPFSAGVGQQVAFFTGLLGIQVAFVAGARVLARVGAHWRSAPPAADHVLVRRAGFVFSAGLALAACGWTVALVAAGGGQAPPRTAPLLVGGVLMILATIAALATTIGRRVVPTGTAPANPDRSMLGAAERLLQWASRRPRTFCACVAILAALAAMPHAETTATGELIWGVIEAGAVIAGYVLLGPTLELRSTPAQHVRR